MSEQETWIGRIIPLKRNDNESDEVYFERVTGGQWSSKDYYSENMSDAIFYNDFYEKFVYLKGVLYELDAKNIEDTGYFCKLHPLPDGSYNFCTSFYNGGTCLNEMLEDNI